MVDDITDSDGDGIPDVIDEVDNAFGTTRAVDVDGDGIADEHDLDDDNDGIPDSVELDGNPTRDTDNDGIIDSKDLDSDNDGILDLIESGQDATVVDTNNDGQLDSTTDADNDGLRDVVDVDDNDANSIGNVNPIDSDVDGLKDFQDVDADNDGLSDLIEVGISTSNDTNNDGMIDGAVDVNGVPLAVVSITTPTDLDTDNIPNYRDLDSDNDGLTDIQETNGNDVNNDGLVDTNGTLSDPTTFPVDGNGAANVFVPNNPSLPGSLDSNADGMVDDITDSDGDGIPDVIDEVDNAFGTTRAVDVDGDGIADEHDSDSDNDGIPDVVEEKGDVNRDTDGDGIIDSLDLDSDNDGLLDIIEAMGVDSDNDGRVDNAEDSDKDGLADTVDASVNVVNNPSNENEGRLASLLLIPDSDNDGNPDFQDVDSDNDGLSDLVEVGLSVDEDTDNDGMMDGAVDDNGVSTNISVVETPLDSDGDGIPDYKELDSDNDGKYDIIEIGAEDSDQNGLVDINDTLVDMENVADDNENAIPNYREFNAELLADIVPNQELAQVVIIPVLENDELSGYNSDTLQITGTQNIGDSLIIANEGTWSISSDNEIVFTPEEGFLNNPRSITYSLENNNEERIGTAMVVIYYTPEVKADNRIADLSEPVTIKVLENDNGDLNRSSVEIELPTGFMEEHPSANLSEDKKKLVVPGQGTWVVNTDGTITYRIEAGIAIVNPTPISYSVADEQGQRLSTNTSIVLNQSVVADETVSEEDCEVYEDDSVALDNNWSLILVVLLGTLMGAFFFRREKI